MAEVQVLVSAGRDQELQRSTTLRANVHQVVIDDAYLQRVACSSGPVHSWCMAHRTVACMPEAISCKKGWRMSERVTYGCACFIRRRCFRGEGVSGSASAWALASCWPNFWPELHASWPAACLSLAWGHLLRGNAVLEGWFNGLSLEHVAG